MTQNIELLTYNQLLDILAQAQASGVPNHLLLGNGFNNAIKVQTDYHIVYERLMCQNGIYGKISELSKTNGFNLEKVIEELQKRVEDIEGSEFLQECIGDRIKLDFMKVLHQLVDEQFDGITRERKWRIWRFLSHFDSYFTLNFDPLLYLLLLQSRDLTIFEDYDYLVFKDGFFRKQDQGPLIFEPGNPYQNFFFLHGTLYLIYNPQLKKVIKVSRSNPFDFSDHINAYIHYEGGNIVCVFYGTSEQKKEYIRGNEYLLECHRRFSRLSGNVAIFGCGFSENDLHVYEKLRCHGVKNIYILTYQKAVCEEGIIEKAYHMLQTRNIRFFDLYAKTPWSYKLSP